MYRGRLKAWLISRLKRGIPMPLDATDFPESNYNFGAPIGWDKEKDPECYVLPLYKYTAEGSRQEQHISCWPLSFRQRLLVLLTGKIWLGCYGLQPPVFLTLDFFSSPLESRARKETT